MGTLIFVVGQYFLYDLTVVAICLTMPADLLWLGQGIVVRGSGCSDLSVSPWRSVSSLSVFRATPNRDDIARVGTISELPAITRVPARPIHRLLQYALSALIGFVARAL